MKSKQDILKKYNLSPATLIDSGMETEVYSRDVDTVLKIYEGPEYIEQLRILQGFYNQLDRTAVPYELPRIDAIIDEDPFVVVIEKRLNGQPMSSFLPNLSKRELDGMMETYLAAALALSNLWLLPEWDRYKLFDSKGLSLRERRDWHCFLARFLAYKYTQIHGYLARDVIAFDAKTKQLQSLLSQPYKGEYTLIHGDFFPGNLLLDRQWRVTALLDFGLLTMYGEALFDLATGWVLFDMYDELKANLRQRYLDILLATLGEQCRGQLYRYVLIYSILSANTYSSQCADGHYGWCVANLNNQVYWRYIE